VPRSMMAMPAIWPLSIPVNGSVLSTTVGAMVGGTVVPKTSSVVVGAGVVVVGAGVVVVC